MDTNTLQPCRFCGETLQLQIITVDRKNPGRDLIKCRMCKGEAPRSVWNSNILDGKLEAQLRSLFFACQNLLPFKGSIKIHDSVLNAKRLYDEMEKTDQLLSNIEKGKI